MAIQKPDLTKFKKPSQAGNNKNKKSELKTDDLGGSMFMNMGKAALPMLPKWVKYAVGVAVFFIAWGLVSFNYCMIIWFGWYYLLAILLTMVLVRTFVNFKDQK